MDIRDLVSQVKTLAGTGLVRPIRPDRLVGMGLALARWGISPATAFAAGAARHPDRLAVVGDEGRLTYREVDTRSEAVARGLRDLGLREGEAVGLLARNSHDFVTAMVALTKLGADIVYLNTGFGGPALKAALDDEEATAVLYDAEFADLLQDALEGRRGVVVRGEATGDGPTLEGLASSGGEALEPPDKHGRHVILTSGTTGKAKGAARTSPEGLSGLDPLTSLLGAIPLRAEETTVVAAPMFHTWGFAHLTVGSLLGSTLVVSRRFDPERTLALVDEHAASTLVVVPVMLQRILDLEDEVLDRYSLRSLRVVAVSGSALPVEVATRFMDRFGDVVYNLYGSTEVAYASVASPADMREAPGTVGRPPRGTVVRILDEDGKEKPTGEVGRIFVGNSMTFTGYTGGQDKDRVDGLVSSGDVGRFDEAGRLFVEGRDDDMIVSGGENVFPGEVEELLIKHDAVADVAVVGVPDEQYGARLVAFVVPAGGGDVDVDALRGYVKDNLATYKVPRSIEVLEELPRNETGKVLKRELKERLDS